jgi:hypothetical protein
MEPFPKKIFFRDPEPSGSKKTAERVHLLPSSLSVFRGPICGKAAARKRLAGGRQAASRGGGGRRCDEPQHSVRRRVLTVLKCKIRPSTIPKNKGEQPYLLIYFYH